MSRIGVGAGGTLRPLHERVACGQGVEANADPLRRALVLPADYELNPSSFAVRVAALIAAVLLAGRAARSGPRHGSAEIEALMLLCDAEQRGARPAVGRWLASGRPLPGFDHPFYPSGDPRAAAA